MYNSGMVKNPSPASIISKRRKWNQNQQHQPPAVFKHIGIGFLAVISILLVAGIAVAALTYARITTDLPSIEGLPGLLG